MKTREGKKLRNNIAKVANFNCQLEKENKKKKFYNKKNEETDYPSVHISRKKGK